MTPQPYTPFKPTEKKDGDMILTAKGWVVVGSKGSKPVESRIVFMENVK